MIREIIIRPALNGFIVQVGCQTLVFDDVDILTHQLNHYLRRPEETEKYYLETSINVKHILPQPPTNSYPTAGIAQTVSEQLSMQPRNMGEP